MAEEVETIINIQEPDYLAELKPELEALYKDAIKLINYNGTLESANDQEWHVILLEEKLLIIDGRAMFKGKQSASQRARAFLNNNHYGVIDLIRRRLGWDPAKYPNPDWNHEKDATAQKLSREYRDMWKEENIKVLCLREYREQYGALAEI